MSEEYIIIGDIHGDITILFNIINNIFHIDINKDNLNDINKIINSNKIIVLLGDIFDSRNEKQYDIKYYDYNIINNKSYNKNSFENYKDNEFINCLNIIKLLKEKLKDKLILILGNHDIRYYKQYDLAKINNINDNNIINEIKEYLIFIKNNFIMYYSIKNIIFNHYYNFNNNNIITDDLNKLINYLNQIIEYNNFINNLLLTVYKVKNINELKEKEINYILDFIIENKEEKNINKLLYNYINGNIINSNKLKSFEIFSIFNKLLKNNISNIILKYDYIKLFNYKIKEISKLIEKTNNNDFNIKYNDTIINNNNIIFIKGHEKQNDNFNKKKNIYLDNRMSKYKYNDCKCLYDNCNIMYLLILINENNINLIKYNNFKNVYSIQYKLDELFIINDIHFSFYNNYNYCFYNNNIINNYHYDLNNIKEIINNDINNIKQKINLIDNNNLFINHKLLNNIYNINKKLNIHNIIIKYKENKIMDEDNKYYNYIYDNNLNIIGKIKINKLLLEQQIGGKYLFDEIEDNYYKFISYNENEYIIGKDNYKTYINKCINNYYYLNLNFKSYDKIDHKNEIFEFNNNNYKLIVYYMYLMIYNYLLTNEDFINYNKNYNNIYNSNNIINIRMYNICYSVEDLIDRKLNFSNILYIICCIQSSIKEYLINYKLIYLCYDIMRCIKLKDDILVKKLNYNELYNKLLNKIRFFNKQKNPPIFVLNNVYKKYEDKFDNNDFELKYITQINIYCLYYIYKLNISNELNNEIKLLLNLNN